MSSRACAGLRDHRRKVAMSLERSWFLNKLRNVSGTARRGTPEKVRPPPLWPGLNMVPVLLSLASQKEWEM